MSEVCANCAKPIGSLETPRVWKDAIVCGKCWAMLDEDENPKPVVREPVQVMARPATQPQVVVMRETAPAIQQPQVVYVPQPAPQINVSATAYGYAPAKGNGVISTLAVICAVVALLVSWVPVVGMIAMPLAILAVLLGVVGFLLNVVTRAPLGMPVAAVLLSVIAIVVQMTVTSATVAAVSHVADKARVAATRPVTQPATTRAATMR